MPRISGGCLCGAVTYSGDCDIARIVNCHCTDCQKATGAVHGTNLFVPEDQISVSGTLQSFSHTADSGATLTKKFCPTCGSQVLGQHSGRPGVMVVRAGSLDDKSLIRPQLNVFTDSMAPSTPLDPSLPSFPRMP